MDEPRREGYFDLSVADQRELLRSLAPVTGRRAEILEKDIWLCLVLDVLFRLPCRKPMAFKGGTSLSEFGGRNSTLPQSTLAIAPDVAECVADLAFPVAQVSVLSAARTFWEKATLIHVECHRPTPRPSAERLSRHWYDLARLADHDLGRRALLDSALLRDVLRIKETFYRSGFSHYDRCLAGGLRLIPEEPVLEALRDDYQAMLAAGMFYGDTLAFDAIVDRLRGLEAEINFSR